MVHLFSGVQVLLAPALLLSILPSLPTAEGGKDNLSFSPGTYTPLSPTTTYSPSLYLSKAMSHPRRVFPTTNTTPWLDSSSLLRSHVREKTPRYPSVPITADKVFLRSAAKVIKARHERSGIVLVSWYVRHLLLLLPTMRNGSFGADALPFLHLILRSSQSLDLDLEAVIVTMGGEERRPNVKALMRYVSRSAEALLQVVEDPSKEMAFDWAAEVDSEEVRFLSFPPQRKSAPVLPSRIRLSLHRPFPADTVWEVDWAVCVRNAMVRAIRLHETGETGDSPADVQCIREALSLLRHWTAYAEVRGMEGGFALDNGMRILEKAVHLLLRGPHVSARSDMRTSRVGPQAQRALLDPSHIKGKGVLFSQAVAKWIEELTSTYKAWGKGEVQIKRAWDRVHGYPRLAASSSPPMHALWQQHGYDIDGVAHSPRIFQDIPRFLCIVYRSWSRGWLTGESGVNERGSRVIQYLDLLNQELRNHFCSDRLIGTELNRAIELGWAILPYITLFAGNPLYVSPPRCEFGVPSPSSSMEERGMAAGLNMLLRCSLAPRVRAHLFTALNEYTRKSSLDDAFQPTDHLVMQYQDILWDLVDMHCVDPETDCRLLDPLLLQGTSPPPRHASVDESRGVREVDMPATLLDVKKPLLESPRWLLHHFRMQDEGGDGAENDGGMCAERKRSFSSFDGSSSTASPSRRKNRKPLFPPRPRARKHGPPASFSSRSPSTS